MSDFNLVDPRGWEYDLQSVCVALLPAGLLMNHSPDLLCLYGPFPIAQYSLVCLPARGVPARC